MQIHLTLRPIYFLEENRKIILTLRQYFTENNLNPIFLKC